MGTMTQRCRWIIAVLCVLALNGCVSAVSAIPGAVYGVVADQFSGEEQSFPYNIEKTLAATQRALRKMQLSIDLLEIRTDGGYGIAFDNDKLDGEITLTRQTGRLTTVHIRVRELVRQESVERAILQMIAATLKQLQARARIDRRRLNNLRAKPSIKSRRVGWYRPGARLDAYKTGNSGWLKIRMPSGKMAYLKGTIKK